MVRLLGVSGRRRRQEEWESGRGALTPSPSPPWERGPEVLFKVLLPWGEGFRVRAKP
jgi:hypothetical protein